MDSGRVLWPCTPNTRANCSHNGVCGLDGVCHCAPGWAGHACNVLALAPINAAFTHLGFRDVDQAGRNVSSWGGSIVQEVNSTRLPTYHMFASEITGGCGMSAWCQNSQIVRATATDPAGPWTRAGVVFPVFAHEPSVARDPTTGGLAMFFTAQRPSTRQRCTACADGVTRGPCPDTDQCNPDTDPTWLSTAPSPLGPWSEPIVVLNGTGSDSNLAPLILTNGSLIAIWRSFAPTPTHPWFGSKMHLLTASRWDDPATYVRHTEVNLFPTLGSPTGLGGAEDPFLWQAPNGVFHVLLHAMYGCATGIGSRPCGIHGWSTDGWTWQLTGAGAYNATVALVGGETFAMLARERPHLVFGTDGAPTHLSNGAVYSADASITLVQPISQSAG